MKNLLILLLGGVGMLMGSTPLGVTPRDELSHAAHWRVQPSFKFDILCLLNTLTADPYYLSYYQEEYEQFEPLLTAEVKQALKTIKQRIKGDKKSIISAFLCVHFSVTDDKNIDEMLSSLENIATLKDRLKKTPYFNNENWQLYELIYTELRTIFKFLKKINYESYWATNILPRIIQKKAEIESSLSQYSIIEEVEPAIGYSLPSDEITVYLLYFSQPHSIRLTGARFLSDIAWPVEIVVQNAIHEMMHPPYDIAADHELRRVLASLKADPFLMDKVLNHNPDLGYNSFAEFIEEDCVQAVEQIICEKLKIENDAHERWQKSDQGMHVLAVVIYSLMKVEKYSNQTEKIRDFLIRMSKLKKLAPGEIESLYNDFYKCSGDSVDQK